MVYFYNQNNNHGYYDQPTHATGHALATTAMVLGIGALSTCWTFYFTIFLGSLSICLALLSKGFEKKMLVNARVGIICAVCGFVLAILFLIAAVILTLSDPQALLDLGSQLDQNYLEIFGQSAESAQGYSYTDLIKQFLSSFS